MEIETLNEFIHRISIEQQWQDRYDKQQGPKRLIYCGPKQNVTADQLYRQMKGK